MSKNRIKPNMDKFAMFILSHGRPEYAKTVECLARSGYTGNIVFIVDDQDKKGLDYVKKYGNENVYVFNKEFVASWTDSMNNFHDRKAAVFARNVCWDIAKELGYDYFCVMDDDTESFAYKQPEKELRSRLFGEVCKYFVEYLINSPLLALAFSQGGDHIGGYKKDILVKRKCMNSWFCCSDRPFSFFGVMNDDVNAYLRNGYLGDVFLTYMPFQLDQADTQKGSGGMVEAYINSGTYVKSFYSVMLNPAVVKIKLMGADHPRLHHSIAWKNLTPCIINETYKK